MIGIAQSIWNIFSELAIWLIAGPWYEIVLKVSGFFSVLLLIRLLYFVIDDVFDDEGVMHYLSLLVFIFATIAWIFLLIVIVLVAFFR